MTSKIIVFISFLFVSSLGFSQHHEEAKHRVAFVLGHSYISLDNKEVLSIPTFGLDYEYWFNNHWGLGIFSDVELITKEISPTVHGKSIEREYPVVFTLDALWNPCPRWEYVIGPGFVAEKGEIDPLIRFGVEYDLNFGHHWDVAPNLFYDQKMDGGYAISIGIGIGKSF